MNISHRSLLLLPLLAACAGAPAVPTGPRFQPAGKPLPAPATIGDATEQAKLSDITVQTRLADTARDAGNADAARAGWKDAGTGLLALGATPSQWRLVYQAAGARLLQQAGDYEGAAAAAQRLLADPDADAESRAVGARTRAAALNQLATAEIKAGRLEPLSNAGADKRKGKALQPRPPADVWKRLLEADDAYVKVYKADPEPGLENAAGAAYQAGLIEYTHDNMDEAARRLWGVVDQFPSARVLSDAVGLWLQTFLVRGDAAGHAAGLDRAAAAVQAEARRVAAAPATAEGKARGEALARLQEQLQREKEGLGFSAGSRLLAEGKGKEAATALEAFAAQHPEHPDAPSALYNAAIGWTQAKERKKAVAAREAVIARYPTSRVAPKALLALAGDLYGTGDHAGAAKLYAQYLERWPTGDDRCLAALNVGAELDAARNTADAAQRYLAFGTDPQCSKADPNTAAQVLYRAAAILAKGGKKADAQAALKALAGLGGVTDATARSYVEDARARVK
ncbi:MAG: outer membrane protein assembly factor BamD [Deltaproteobacteria bacterium]|nr:outer membrane protein assembly factor BamD [Deltaproteobacteria bacterium]